MNGYRVAQCKGGEERPCIRIHWRNPKSGDENIYVKKVKFIGPAEIVQGTFDPQQPNKPFIWIETDGPIEYEK